MVKEKMRLAGEMFAERQVLLRRVNKLKNLLFVTKRTKSFHQWHAAERRKPGLKRGSFTSFRMTKKRE